MSSNKIAFTKVTAAKNTVNVNEKVKFTVYAHSITEEPKGYRLSFRLGNVKVKT